MTLCFSTCLEILGRKVSKLTKAQAKAHHTAGELLKKEALTLDEKWFVLENWQESATHINSISGAFFTPPALARDFSIEVAGHRIVDLCAGIGTLAFAYYQRSLWGDRAPQITCIEKNPDYIAVGRKVLPEARWIEADIFDLPMLEHFDCAISNPPFGATSREGDKSPRYSGQKFEYHAIDIASDLADFGVFIIPQSSAPFAYSGVQSFQRKEHTHYRDFALNTGLAFEPSCGIDCSVYRADWHGVAPAVEIVTVDFAEARRVGQQELFREIAA